jgi:hypothetical protein
VVLEAVSNWMELRKEKNKFAREGNKFVRRKGFCESEDGEQVSVLLNFNCVWLEEFCSA